MAVSPQYILALDLGTTGNRAFVFNAAGQVVSQAYQELTQYYPQPGWLEHDPMEIWQATCTVMQSAIQQAGIQPSEIAAMGLTVQRETCLLWDKTTGQPLHRAIVWQDRRTASLCQKLQNEGYGAEIFERTGLVIDAYFSATKLAWLLEHTVQAENVALDQVLAGTIDTWILWNLTGRNVHATDDSNASRTMLYNLTTRQWDERLLSLFNIPAHLLPTIQPSLGYFGATDPQVAGAEIPIMAILGDQQASLFGHGCDRPGLVKCTYGTGSFLVAHTGNQIVRSPHQLIATIAWSQSSAEGETTAGYALEGSMFTTGACIQWLRDGLGLIRTADETDALAQQVSDNGGVYFVPALSGLGTPHWDMDARGAFLGITGGVQRPHMVRAVLEAVAYQVKEVVEAINSSGAAPIERLKVDGGACQNNFLMQLQADVLGIPVERPRMQDTTVQGVAFAAGIASGFWPSRDGLQGKQVVDRVFEPGEGGEEAIANFATWQKAVERAKHWA
ncbi:MULTISPECIES: glycerol kinase GlpK [unclassified Leptolyngbya]|uniref:glycerol kinase GlpK n=1 Tax=unclassified Leptolyngbya TaxID=2650499 RepID=UPI001681FA4E|nr:MULTISPECIES: glycerol kinase GlpK [unclassified Leptolyngbya]MBD1913969.1 glycerol kinase GlpK [Leptolyngbya sp. FACHB-8]MBD2155936.1 glycerol kinase GlpK [Leptolyngbya sp. FACHB-16]